MVQNPNESITTRTAAPLATLSSHSDPMPHFFMAGACGVGSAYAYNKLANPRTAGIAALCSLGYLYAGQQISKGEYRMGYDVGTITSIALTAATGPRAYHSGESYHVALSALGGISSLGNLLKSYQMRTGKPRELKMDH
ncbi:hypothetical protein BKA69DRAFT_1124049 [Paraphysoderma sedebokerense]|nr:hypothetical protein BKA69DRAFT_1124049 [Paraphysoderma sedebokerense]